jgi:hypothetical protein
VTDQALRVALDYCLTDDARKEARHCSRHAVTSVEALRERFVQTLKQPDELDRRFQTRLNSTSDRSWMASHVPVNPGDSTTATPESESGKSIARRIARLLGGTRRD